MNYFKFKYCILNESPWILIVSTASFAVFLLDFEVYGIENCMLGWFGIVSQAANAARKTVLTNIGGYAGIILNNYGTKPRSIIYGDVVYTPENYSPEAQKFLKNLAGAYGSKDKNLIYQGWRILMCNPEGIFNTNYGKLCNTVNAMTNDYNARVDSKDQVSEKECFISLDIVVSSNSLSFNKTDQFNNMIETAQTEIVNRKARGMLEYRRNFNQEQLDGIANLGLQSNNDYIVIVKYDKNTGGIHVCYVDGKKLGEEDFRLKLSELNSKGYDLEAIPQSRFIFGCNIYMIATKNENVILNEVEKQTVISFLGKMANANPEFFKNYESSTEFLEFQKSGNISVLAGSVFPFPKVLSSFDFRKYFKFNIVNDQDLINKFIRYDNGLNPTNKGSYIDTLNEIIQNDS